MTVDKKIINLWGSLEESKKHFLSNLINGKFRRVKERECIEIYKHYSTVLYCTCLLTCLVPCLNHGAMDWSRLVAFFGNEGT